MLLFAVQMKALKVWATRLWSGLDRAVAEFEDHEALIGAALRELDEAGQAAHKELERVRHDGMMLTRRLAQERVNADGWREAAARQGSDIQALELLRQARRARRRAHHLVSRLEEHTAAEGHLAGHAAALAERIETLKHQHHLMRTRTAQAEAMPAFPLETTPIEELFERWDMTLTRGEHLGDPFDELHREEEERAVRDELRQLRKKAAE